MNKLKFTVFAVLGTAVLTMGLFSCNNEEVINSQQENVKTVNSDLKSRPATTSDEGYSYALSFYNTEISLGESVNLIDSETSQGVTVSEVIVNGDTRARGYIVNRLNSGEFLYFTDVDRTEDVLTTYEKNTTETLTFTNLIESPDYLITDKFDFIEYSQSYMTTYGKNCNCSFWRKLWGNCDREVEKRPVTGGSGGCMTWTKQDSHFLGFTLGDTWLPSSGIVDC